MNHTFLSNKIYLMCLRFFCLVLFVFSLPSFAVEKKFQDYIVAKINNVAITNSELDDRIKLFQIISGSKSRTKSQKEILRSVILAKMIEESLIKQDAKNSGIDLTKSDIEHGLEIISLSRNLDLESIKKNLSKYKINFDVFKDQVKVEILWSKIIATKIRPQISVMQNEIDQMLKQNNLIKKQQSFLISEILIENSDNDKILAQKIYEELNSGLDFEELARNFSQSYSFENGSKIGWVNNTQINQQIYEIISSLKVGEHSKPHKISNNYRIFKLHELKISDDIDQDEVSKIEAYIKENKARVKSKSYLMDLKKKAFIEVAG